MINLYILLMIFFINLKSMTFIKFIIKYFIKYEIRRERDEEKTAEQKTKNT